VLNLLPPILLVDDEPDDLRLASLVLEREFGDVTIEQALDGPSFTRAVAQRSFGLVITEHRLPWADGPSVVRLVREARPGCPVILFTRGPAPELAAAALRLQVDGWVDKSSGGFLELPEAVREALFRARRRAIEGAPDAPYRRLFEGLPVGVFMAASNGQIVEANRALADILGFDGPAQLTRRSVHGFFASRSVAEGWRSRLEASGSLGNIDTELQRADGRRVWVRVSAWFIEDPDSGIRQIQGIVEETGAYHDAQEELARRTADLARSNEDLEQMAYVVSHDLQQPLTAISRFLGLLGEHEGDRLSDEANGWLDHALKGTENLQGLVDAVLRYSRIETAGRDFSTVDLSSVMNRVLDLLADQIAGCGAEIAVDMLPTVTGDAAQLEQLFQNLISNAIKFRGQAAPLVRVSSETDAEGWHLSFSDNGIGLDPADADRIFVMFQRLHTDAEYPGTGIGLAVCKRIVFRHGGRIWVESAPGRGAVFHVTLPRERAEITEESVS